MVEPQQKPVTVSKYPFNDEQLRDLNKRFSYHAPKEDQPGRYLVLRERAYGLAVDVLRFVPPGREQSLALTKLEEVVMWANAGIARGE